MAQELYIAAATKVRNQTLQDGRIQLKKTLLVRVTSDETSPSKNVPKQVALTSLFIASGISSSLNDFPNIISIDYSGLHVASVVKWRSVSKSDPHWGGKTSCAHFWAGTGSRSMRHLKTRNQINVQINKQGLPSLQAMRFCARLDFLLCLLGTLATHPCRSIDVSHLKNLQPDILRLMIAQRSTERKCSAQEVASRLLTLIWRNFHH